MSIDLSAEQKASLLALAKQSLLHGLESGEILPLQLDNYEGILLEVRACFVTLTIGGELRGCIGSLEAYQPLVVDVVHNAYAAAFSDPRFPPLSQHELDKLEIHISVLNPSEAMSFDSEQDLINQLQPGVDGLILEERMSRGTFLPSVWEQLPEAEQFLQHLKLKAGLPADYWSDTLQVSRYTTTAFPED